MIFLARRVEYAEPERGVLDYFRSGTAYSAKISDHPRNRAQFCVREEAAAIKMQKSSTHSGLDDFAIAGA
jgi:hypothetical protein